MRYKLQLGCLILLQVNWLVVADICTQHLHTLAEKQLHYVQCATWNSVPVTLCMGCEDCYTDMKIAYQMLKDEPKCTAKYFDKDRINLVATTHSILIGLWEKAYCDDCFNGNNSFVFDTKSTELSACFQKFKGKECLSCNLKYMDLNDFYKNLDAHNNGKVCYDLQDSMNRTRSQWSKDFKCCRREFNMTLFLVASGIVACLPILFYCSVYGLTKRREANHGILNEDPESETPGTSSASAILPPQRESPVHHEPSKKTVDMDSDSSDEDIISKKLT